MIFFSTTRTFIQRALTWAEKNMFCNNLRSKLYAIIHMSFYNKVELHNVFVMQPKRVDVIVHGRHVEFQRTTLTHFL